MARLSMKAMQKSIKEKAPGGTGSEIWSPMGDMKQGDTASVRLLPFEDEMTGGFWTVQKMISLSFVNPDNDEEEWKVYVPCLEMYESDVKCPVADQARALFKEADELKDSGQTKESKAITDVALAHWIRYAYYFQGFVVSGGKDGLDSNTLTPIKFPKSMYTMIHSSIMDEDTQFEALPTGEFSFEDTVSFVEGEIPDEMDEAEFLELFNGRNYTVKKTEKGGFNNYESSRWDLKETMLEDEQIAAIAESGFIDLRKYLPKRPTEEQYEAYTDMAAVSIERALGQGEGYWNPVWEEEFGIKPIKPKEANEGSSGGSKSGGSLKDRLKSRKKDTESSGEVSDARSKLKASRGAKSDDNDAGNDTTDGDVNDDAGDTNDAAEEKSTESKVSSMKARLAKKKAAAANA